MKTIMMKAAVAAAFALPFSAQATLYQFNASLNSAQEVPANSSTATGFSVLFYDDFGTPDNLADDLLSITTWASGLTAALRNPAGGQAAHIHFPAPAGVNTGVGVNLTTPSAPLVAFYSTGGDPALDSVSFFSTVSGPAPTSTLPIPGSDPQQSITLFGALLAGTAYVNIHTIDFTGGEIRGQYTLVPTIPEPSTYALMLAGLGLVGWVAARRRKVGV